MRRASAILPILLMVGGCSSGEKSAADPGSVKTPETEAAIAAKAREIEAAADVKAKQVEANAKSEVDAAKSAAELAANRDTPDKEKAAD